LVVGCLVVGCCCGCGCGCCCGCCCCINIYTQYEVHVYSIYVVHVYVKFNLSIYIWFITHLWTRRDLPWLPSTHWVLADGFAVVFCMFSPENSMEWWSMMYDYPKAMIFCTYTRMNLQPVMPRCHVLGLNQAQINFPPTYKFDKYSVPPLGCGYQRVPAGTPGTGWWGPVHRFADLEFGFSHWLRQYGWRKFVSFFWVPLC
jgi:hypothetical protein